MQHNMGGGRNAYLNAHKYQKLCEFCGREFTALKATTRFCSDKCSKRAYKQRKRADRIADAEKAIHSQADAIMRKSTDDIQYLSPSLAARILGVNRSTIYRYLKYGFINCIRIGNLTRIPRSEIESHLHENQLQAEDYMMEYATVKELSETLRMSCSSVHRLLAEFRMPVRRHFGKHYYHKEEAEHILLREKEPEMPEITSWITCREIQKVYNIPEHQVYSVAYEHSIPRKTVGRTVYYSKDHVTEAMASREPSVNSPTARYYTTSSAMSSYGMTQNQVLRYVKEYRIPSRIINRTLHFLKSDFDGIFGIPKRNP